jgi:hypothetical protein
MRRKPYISVITTWRCPFCNGKILHRDGIPNPIHPDCLIPESSRGNGCLAQHDADAARIRIEAKKLAGADQYGDVGKGVDRPNQKEDHATPSRG